jgi:membrane-bound inhibitor of C-type lysozyme
MRRLLLTGLFCLASVPAIAAGSAITLDLGTGDGQRQTIRYECEDGIEREVQYLNVAPNFLALVPIEDDTLVFASVIAASGARYAAGQWVWWTKGAQADLYDETRGADSAPVTHCLEITQTP